MRNKIILVVISLIVIAGIVLFFRKGHGYDDRFVSYAVNAKNTEIRFYWKNDDDRRFGSIENLRSWLVRRKKTMVFAMNGGMYKPDHSPQGLYIQEQKTLFPLDSSNGDGNFYLKPNGVFYITNDNSPVICQTQHFKNNGQIKYATQSGPMLVIDGQIHPAFKQSSANLNIRNGVGILPGNKVMFAMSKNAINLFDFASYFKSLGCENALYLDGLVSRTFLPKKNWIQTDGDFGVIIAVTK